MAEIKSEDSRPLGLPKAPTLVGDIYLEDVL